MSVKGNTKKLMIAAVVLCAGLSIRKIYTAIRTASVYKLQISPMLSEKLQDEVAHFVQYDLQNKTPEYIFKALKDQFPMITEVAVRRVNPEYLNIKLGCVQPAYCVNRDLVITQDKQVFPEECFVRVQTKDLPNIKMQHDDAQELMNLPQELKYFASNLGPELTNNFDVNDE